jgi:hypothetical protein
MPKGQAFTQARHRSQASAPSTIAPVMLSRVNAPAGQAARHGALPHRWHTWGLSRPRGSFLTTRSLAAETPKRPSCLATQATWQARHPEHRSYLTPTPLGVIAPPVQLGFGPPLSALADECAYLHPRSNDAELVHLFERALRHFPGCHWFFVLIRPVRWLLRYPCPWLWLAHRPSPRRLRPEGPGRPT